jgi:glycosyltransferase involved in cell wall biosynthesis
MKLSFVIPAHNEERTLTKCLRSVQEEVSRYNFTTEIVVINNASTDRTKEIAQQFPGVRVIDETTKGLIFARKCGMDHTDGELIANIDADIIMPQGWLKIVMDEFKKDPQLVALSGPYIYYDLNFFERILVRIFYSLGYMVYVVCNHVLKISGMLQGGNFIVRRDAMIKIGGYDTRIIFYGEDTDIAKRIRSVGKVKWTFKLPMYTSGRRLKKQGILFSGATYAINYLWPILFSKPFSHTYKDIRE